MPNWEVVEEEENKDQKDKKTGREPITDEEAKHNTEEEQKPQIDDMLNTFGSGDDGRRTKNTLKGEELDEPADEIEEEVDEEEEPEVETEDEVEDAEEEELEEDESEEKEDDVEEEEEPEEEDEDDKDKIIEDLRKQINEQAKGTAPVEDAVSDEPGEEEDEEEPESKQKSDKKTAVEVSEGEVIPFVSQEDLDNLTPDKMNKLLTKVYNQARQDSLRDIPELAAKTVQNRMTQQQVVDAYFEENPEILEVREYAGQIANQVQSENPEMGIREVLTEMDKRVRKNLHIKKKAEDIETKRKEKEEEEEGKKKPGFTRKPRGKRGGGQEEEATGQQKQINELIPE